MVHSWADEMRGSKIYLISVAPALLNRRLNHF
jgi:hypothetical protein